MRPFEGRPGLANHSANGTFREKLVGSRSLGSQSFGCLGAAQTSAISTLPIYVPGHRSWDGRAIVLYLHGMMAHQRLSLRIQLVPGCSLTWGDSR
jgi:hypothetical protein